MIDNQRLLISLYVYLEMIMKLAFATILGGLIGFERGRMNRPAGLRTHVLVCVGSTLIMLVSDFMFKAYQGTADVDPTRLGAQVVSGIGFLGAGTIIREGTTVKGLTTAATLWAVSCIGVSVGAGFYSGAMATSLIIYIVLILFRRFEQGYKKKNRANG